MSRKVYQVDPLFCPQGGGTTKIMAFITDYAVVEKIINHLELSLVPSKPPPPHMVFKKLLIAAEILAKYFLGSPLCKKYVRPRRATFAVFETHLSMA